MQNLGFGLWMWGLGVAQVVTVANGYKFTCVAIGIIASLTLLKKV